jgi:hypothetical protein
MLGIHWRRPSPPPPLGLGAAAPRTAVPVPVSVSSGVDERLPGLGDALGRGIDVVVDEPSRSAVMIVGAIGPAGVAFLRARYPSARVLVLDHYAAAEMRAASGYLDAGADAYLTSASLGEVAAHVRALLRRPRPGTAPGTTPPGGEGTGRQAS